MNLRKTYNVFDRFVAFYYVHFNSSLKSDRKSRFKKLEVHHVNPGTPLYTYAPIFACLFHIC
jgi:hypothetical protein